jgi:hypothetical protein
MNARAHAALYQRVTHVACRCRRARFNLGRRELELGPLEDADRLILTYVSDECLYCGARRVSVWNRLM